MVKGKYVSYLRANTDRQGTREVCLETQRKAIDDYLKGGRWTLCGVFLEVESGRQELRPQLNCAIATCRLYGARLLIAKLDRLSRDVHFLTCLQQAGVQFTAVDMPEANELVVSLLSAVADAEDKAVSKKTKVALAAARARGKALGRLREKGHHRTPKDRADALATGRTNAIAHAEQLAPIFTELWNAGYDSLGSLARELSTKGIPTGKGKSTKWTLLQFSRVLEHPAQR